MYINIEDKETYCSLHSPLWARATEATFAEKRAFFKEFRQIERFIFTSKYQGWNAYTKLDNPKVMRILTKAGAHPYYIDLEYNSIWFYKEVKREDLQQKRL